MSFATFPLALAAAAETEAGLEMGEVVVKLAAVLVLVLLNAFFVATEFALVSVRRTRVQQLIDEGSASARTVMESLNDPNRFVSATQVGITMSSIALGWVGEPAMEQLLAPGLDRAGLTAGTDARHIVSFAFAFLIITYLHVVVGEIAPKSLALQRSERVSMLFARPITLFYTLLRPLIWVLNRSAEALLRVFGVESAGTGTDTHSILSEEELMMQIAHSSKGGVLEDTEEEMLRKVFEFADTNVAEVMVPRPDVVAFAVDEPPAGLLQKVIEQPYTRYPVHSGNMDDVRGILHIRDLFHAAERFGKDKVRIESLLRPAHVVPESKSIAGLLGDFRRSKTHMALVVDEYGSLAGIVTLEDLIEEIVGEIDDEHDVPDRPLERISDNHLRVDGKYPIEDLNEEFGLSLPNGDSVHTIGGFVFSRLGQQPHQGDVVMHEHLRFEVTETDGPRIVHVDIFMMERPQPGDEDRTVEPTEHASTPVDDADHT